MRAHGAVRDARGTFGSSVTIDRDPAVGGPRPPGTTPIRFLAVTFGFTWMLWLLAWQFARHGAAPASLTVYVIVGSFGPLLGAFLCCLSDGGWPRLLSFVRDGCSPRMGWPVFVVSTGLLPVVAIAVAAAFERRIPEIEETWSNLLRSYFWLLILGGALAEEFGWAYLADSLDERLRLIGATALVAAVWAFWHVPLFMLDVPGLSQSMVPFGAFLLMSVAIRFLFSWTFHRGRRNILSTILGHNSLNLSFSMVTIVTAAGAGSQPRLWAFSASTLACAVVLWRFLPPGETVSRRRAQA